MSVKVVKVTPEDLLFQDPFWHDTLKVQFILSEFQNCPAQSKAN